MTSKRQREGAPASTITSAADQRPPRIGTDPIVALWVPAIGVDVPLPYDLRFALGRADGCGALVQHAGVSRHHADMERDGDDLRVINRSKNRIEFRGALRDDFILTAGEMMKLDKVEAFALTRAMAEARQRSAYFLGFGPESTAMRSVVAAALGRSLIVVCPAGKLRKDEDNGPPTTLREEVASALIHASPRATRRRDVVAKQVPSGKDAIRDLCSKTAGGLLYLDATILPMMPSKDLGLLAGELCQPKWNLLQVWTCATEADVHPPLRADETAAWEIVRVPTVATRIERRELPAMIDYLFASLGVGYRTRDLDRDPTGSNLRGLLAYDWPGNHDELRLCVRYMAARLSGASQERAAELLGCDRSWLRRRVAKWGLSL